jgi:hypothetical protein
MTEIALLDRPTTVAGRSEYDDAQRVNAKALRFWPVIWPMLVDDHSRASGDVRRLGDPAFQDSPNGRRRDDVPPSLAEMRGPHPVDGNWFCISNGKGGSDVISIVEHLGSCSRPVALEFLRSLTDRLVEISA